MANTPSDDGRAGVHDQALPDGHFSGLLDDGTISGRRRALDHGPYGVFTLRENERRLLFIGGGAGMAPILALLRSLAEQGSERKAIYYYGARRQEDLFHVEELEALGDGPARRSRFVPALSEEDGRGRSGEEGLITDVVERCEEDLSDVDAYLCGPPPMVEAAMDLLVAKGVDEANIHYDKFTTTEDSEETSPT